MLSTFLSRYLKKPYKSVKFYVFGTGNQNKNPKKLNKHFYSSEYFTRDMLSFKKMDDDILSPLGNSSRYRVVLVPMGMFPSFYNTGIRDEVKGELTLQRE